MFPSACRAWPHGCLRSWRAAQINVCSYRHQPCASALHILLVQRLASHNKLPNLSNSDLIKLRPVPHTLSRDLFLNHRWSPTIQQFCILLSCLSAGAAWPVFAIIFSSFTDAFGNPGKLGGGQKGLHTGQALDRTVPIISPNPMRQPCWLLASRHSMKQCSRVLPNRVYIQALG